MCAVRLGEKGDTAASPGCNWVSLACAKRAKHTAGCTLSYGCILYLSSFVTWIR